MCVGEESCGAPRTFFLKIDFLPDLQKLKKKMEKQNENTPEILKHAGSFEKKAKKNVSGTKQRQPTALA